MSMSTTTMTGAALIIIAIVVSSVWGMWTLFTEPEIPMVIRAFSMIIILGAVVLLVALIVDRLKDMKKEHFPKT